MIIRRKSTRQYTGEALSPELLEQILAFAREAKPLDASIRTQVMLLDKSQVHCLQPWKTPHFLAFFSEEKEGWLENAGFMYQQLDLYIQSLRLGSCWVGLGTLENNVSVPEGMKLVILMPFGDAKEEPWRDSPARFSRKAMEEITDQPDERLEPARLAPSATNSQPWFFLHEGEVIHAYRVIHGAVRQRMLGRFNQLDMGIALAHLYVSCPDSFETFTVPQPPEKQGWLYTRSFRL